MQRMYYRERLDLGQRTDYSSDQYEPRRFVTSNEHSRNLCISLLVH